MNTKPRPGEQKIYSCASGWPFKESDNRGLRRYRSVAGPRCRNRLFILAGITTLGTQAAAEYVSKPEYIKEMISSLNTAPAGTPPRLPSAYQLLVKVKVTGGVPVHIAYVTHHVL